jgi:thiol:disulfide interchange protein
MIHLTQSAYGNARPRWNAGGFRRFLCVLVLCVGVATGCGQVPSAAPAHGSFTLVEITPAQGQLADLLKQEASKASALGQTPFVEFYADWCAPCRALRKSLDDPRMIEAFDRTYIVQLNADTWSDKLAGSGFSAAVIPVFFGLDANGKPNGRTLNGGAWGEDIPANMAPPLKAFFRTP